MMRTKEQIDCIFAEYKGQHVCKWDARQVYNQHHKWYHHYCECGEQEISNTKEVPPRPNVKTPRADSISALVNFAVEEGIRTLKDVRNKTIVVETFEGDKGKVSTSARRLMFFRDFPSPAEAEKAALGNVICDVIEAKK